jgi:hypothetical protein
MQSNPGGGPPAFAPFNLNPNEPISEFLIRRERELTQQIDALRGQITPKEHEREQVRTAMRALGLSNELTGTMLDTAWRDRIIGNSANLGDLVGLANSTRTIKQMVLDALKDHFHEGATPSELRDYIRVAYRREVDRNSISPQLSRLREEGLVLQLDGPAVLPGRWILTPPGVSAADLIAIGHWPPGAEHQPREPSDEELAREIEAEGLLGKVSVEQWRRHRPTARQERWYGKGPKKE